MTAPPPIVFDEMTAADVDAVVEIEEGSFERPWRRGQFLRELENEISRIIVARRADAPNVLLGYVCRWLIGDEMQILNLAVHPDHRREGVGRKMMELILDEGRRTKVEIVTLEVRDGNAAAVGLYECLGFTRVGRRRNYYGSGADGVLMTLKISSKDAGRA